MLLATNLEYIRPTDLKTAKDRLKDENYYASAFFSQRCAEKALKRFFIF